MARLTLFQAIILMLVTCQQPGPQPDRSILGFSLGHSREDKTLAERMLADVDKHYNALATMNLHFEEFYRVNGRERRASGEAFFKKLGLMRWEYDEPEEKLFVCDGKTAYLYSPSDRLVRHAPIKKIDDLRSPLRFLLGKSRLARELERANLPDEVKPLRPGNIVISGKPTNYSDRVETVWVEVSPEHRIDRLVIKNVDGAETEFRFSNQQENIKIQDARFRFTPPSGVEVVEDTVLE